MSSDSPYKLTTSPTTISIGKTTAVVSLDWYNLLKGISEIDSIVAKNKNLNAGVINHINEVSQVAFLESKFKNQSSPIPAIIANLLANNEINGTWFFVHRIDDDLIWFFVVNEFGQLDIDTDYVLSNESFYDILDEYLLVADQRIKLFSSNFVIDAEYTTDVEESVISTDILERIAVDSKVVSLGKTRIFGLSVSTLFSVLTILAIIGAYFMIEFLIAPLEPSETHTSQLEEIVVADDVQEWDKIKEIMSDTRHPSFIYDYLTVMIPYLPIDIGGWDARKLKIEKKAIMAYSSSSKSKIPLSVFRKSIIENMNHPKQLFSITSDNLSATDARDRVKIEWDIDYIEKIGGYSSITDYKKFLGEDVRQKKIVEAADIKIAYDELLLEASELVDAYANLNPFQILYEKVIGDYEQDSLQLQNIVHNLDLNLNRYNDLLKDVLKPIIPNPKILQSLSLPIAKSDNIFDFRKKTGLIEITATRQKTETGLIKTDIKLKGTGLITMNKLIKYIHSYLPLRVGNITYDWMKSEWTLTGHVYEN